MSQAELPGPLTVAAIALFSAPFVVLALRAANRILPARPGGPHRWSAAEGVAVLAVPFVAFLLIARLVAPEADQTLELLLWNQVAFGGCALAALGFALRQRGGLAAMGLAAGPPPASAVLVPLVYVPGFLFFVVAVQSTWVRLLRMLGWEEQQEVMRMILDMEGDELRLAALLAIVVGPLIEELVFRGFLQSALAGALGERLALVLTALVFALLHGMAGLPALFALSLFLGWLQLRTRCILVPWFAHALNNGVMLALALNMPDGVEP